MNRLAGLVLLLQMPGLGAHVTGASRGPQERVALVIDFVSMNSAAKLDSLGVVEMAQAALDSAGMKGYGVKVTGSRAPLPYPYLRVGLELYSSGEVRYEHDLVGPDGLVVPGCHTRFITVPKEVGTEADGLTGVMAQGLRCLNAMGAASANKQVAPAPREARLRRTPAQACGPLEAVPGRIKAWCHVEA